MEDFYHLREDIKNVMDERQADKTTLENFFTKLIDETLNESSSTRTKIRKAQSKGGMKLSRGIFELPEMIKLRLQK